MSISTRHWNRLCRAHVGYSLPEPGWLWSMTVTGGVSWRSCTVRMFHSYDSSEEHHWQGCNERRAFWGREAFFLGPVPYSDLPTIRLLWWLSPAKETLAVSEEISTDAGLSFLPESEAFLETAYPSVCAEQMAFSCHMGLVILNVPPL